MKHTVKLNQNYLFRRIYRVGKSQVTPYFAVYTMKNRTKGNRLGITATKKIGNAVQRNRARRILMEAYRLLEDKLPTGLDIVIVARKKTVYAKMQPVMESLARVFEDRERRAGKVPPQKSGKLGKAPGTPDHPPDKGTE